METIEIQGKQYVTVNERIKYFREKFAGYSMTSEIIFFNQAEIKEYKHNPILKDDKSKEKELVKTNYDREIIELKGKPADILIKAVIKNKEGQVVAEGLAYEKEGSSFINKTSFVENAETSAWGRALANFGIGVDSSVASADEVANAIKQQSNNGRVGNIKGNG